jgi:hypothetical protein
MRSYKPCYFIESGNYDLKKKSGGLHFRIAQYDLKNYEGNTYLIDGLLVSHNPAEPLALL